MNKDSLREFLVRHKLGPDELAKIIGVSHMAVLHWLDGRRSISLTVNRLCRLFDRHPELMREFAE